MREIVGFQLGNCGNSLGSNFWNCLSYEHGINENGRFRGDSDLQLERINVYYDEGFGGSCYVPRAIGVDLEGARLETVLSGRDGKMFRPENFVGGQDGGSNNYGRGYFSDGHEMIDRILDVSRRETERCDSPQGYQILHGVGGGTGAGLTGLLIERLKDEFMEKMIMSFSVLPSPKVSDIVVEPYNAVLGMKHLVQDTELSFCLDNEALYSSCTNGLGMSAPRFADLNFLISNAISGITTCLRFPGQLNTGLMKLAVNAVPFPRLHFMIPSYVPLIPRAPARSKTSSSQIPIRVSDMVRELLHPRCRMVAADLRRGKFLTATSIFRGRMSTREVETSLKLIKDRNSKHFVNWIPDNAKIAICDIPPRGVRRAATFFANNTAIAAVWVRILEQFRAMYRRRAYLHWYKGEGMEEQDFDEAETILLDLIDEYIPYSSNLFPTDNDDDDDGLDDDHETEIDAYDAPSFAAGFRKQNGKQKTNSLPKRKMAAANVFHDFGAGDGVVGKGLGRRRGGGGGGGGGGSRRVNHDDFDNNLPAKRNTQLSAIQEEDRSESLKSENEGRVEAEENEEEERTDAEDGDADAENYTQADALGKPQVVDVDGEEWGMEPISALALQHARDVRPEKEVVGKLDEIIGAKEKEDDDDDDFYGDKDDGRKGLDSDEKLEQDYNQDNAIRYDDGRYDEDDDDDDDDDGGDGGFRRGAAQSDAHEEDDAADDGDGNDDDDDDDDDLLNQFVNDIKMKKRNSQDPYEFDRIMDQKDSK